MQARVIHAILCWGGQVPALAPLKEDVDVLLRHLRRVKAGTRACGAIILNTNLDKCLLVRGSNNSRASFGWPKGKAEGGETDAACAIREVYEEIGLDISRRIRCLRRPRPLLLCVCSLLSSPLAANASLCLLSGLRVQSSGCSSGCVSHEFQL